MAAVTGESKDQPRINIDQPQYDQTTYIGRAKHFFITTNPLNLFATKSQLERAHQLVTQYRSVIWLSILWTYWQGLLFLRSVTLETRPHFGPNPISVPNPNPRTLEIMDPGNGKLWWWWWWDVDSDGESVQLVFAHYYCGTYTCISSVI